MTEKEKMLDGQFYNAWDKELHDERNRARELLHEFNTSLPGENEKRKLLLHELFQTKVSLHIEPPFYCDYGYNIRLGKNFYANFGCTILDVNQVTIGDNVKFGPNVQVYTATHPLEPHLRQEGKEMGYPITIGNNVWIGGGSILLPGIIIGDNTIIGAGSVVTRDIPAQIVAAGNPCKMIKSVPK